MARTLQETRRLCAAPKRNVVLAPKRPERKPPLPPQIRVSEANMEALQTKKQTRLILLEKAERELAAARAAAAKPTASAPERAILALAIQAVDLARSQYFKLASRGVPVAKPTAPGSKRAHAMVAFAIAK